MCWVELYIGWKPATFQGKPGGWFDQEGAGKTSEKPKVSAFHF
jgi:hypothetical protein